MNIRAATDRDRSWMRIILKERWGSPEIVTRGRLHHADQLAGFIAWDQERPVGLVTYTFADGDCEIVSLDSLESGRGDRNISRHGSVGSGFRQAHQAHLACDDQ